MKRLKFLTFIFILFLHLSPLIFAQAAFPKLESDPKALEYYQRGKQGYSWTDLAEISIWASGGDASSLEKLRAAAQALLVSSEIPTAEKEKAEYILTYIHRNFLKSYSHYQTRIDAIFTAGLTGAGSTAGRYNCVSSAVLYMILCKAVFLETAGVITKDHAFITVSAGGENIDVETTNQHGFDPGSRHEFHDAFGKVTGFAYVPANNYRDREAISPIELISLILSNRISELETRKRFAEAVPLAINRAVLLGGSAVNMQGDPSVSFFADPGKDLMDRIFNYGASLLNSGREEDSLAWADYAMTIYPNDERWEVFIHAAVNNRLQKYTRAGQIAQGVVFLDSQKVKLSADDYARFETLLIDTDLLNRANRITNAADGDAVAAAIDGSRADGKLRPERATELLTFAVQKTASAISAAPARDWLGAINYINSALERYGPNRELEQTLQTYRNNRAVDFHNRFAVEWNNKNIDEAQRILDEGLAEFPDNRQLLADKATIQR